MKTVYANIVLIILLLLSQVVPANEKDIPAVSSGDILYYLDYSAFHSEEGKAYVEFYVMIYADQLTLFTQNDKSQALIQLSFTAEDSTGSIITSKEWTTQVVVQANSDIRTQVVYDYWAELMKPGSYKISVNIVDQKSLDKGTVLKNIVIPSMQYEKVGISNVKFLNGIRNDQEEYANQPILNPSRRYGLLNPQVSIYYEVYGNENIINQKIQPTYFIRKDNEKFSKKILDKEIVLNSKSIGLTRAIDVSKLETGLYNLEIQLNMPGSNISCTTARMFEIIQPDYFKDIPLLTDNELTPLKNILSYVGTPQEIDLFEKLDRASKGNFLIRFFRDIDPTHADVENEKLRELFTRYNYANENFGWGMKEGWLTDRGRVLIQNGFPDEVERHDFEVDSKPYEIWYYRNNRQYYYVFGELNANGNYILLHSNKESEINNPSWKLQLNGT